MKKIKSFPFWFTLILPCLLSIILFGEIRAQHIVQVMVTKVGNYGYSTEGKGASRYNISHNGRNLLLSEGCIKAGANGEWTINKYLPSITLNPGESRFSLFVETHNERKTGDCNMDGTSTVTLNKPDIHYKSDYKEFVLSNYPVGEFSQEEEIALYEGNSKAWCFVKIRVSVPTPSVPVADIISLDVCADELLTLTTSVALLNSPSLSYRWEYYVNDDYIWVTNPSYPSCASDCNGWTDPNKKTECLAKCYKTYPNIQIPNWRPFGGSESSQSFRVNDIIRGGLKAKSLINFRVIAKGREIESSPSAILTLSFSPAAPTVDSRKFEYITACPGKKDGGVKINGVVSAKGSYRWFLKNIDAIHPCDDKIPGNCVQIASDYETTPNFEIKQLFAGTYKLFISNIGGTDGLCNRPYVITIPEYPVLKAFATSKGVSCHNAPDGEISYYHTGGAGTVNYKVIRAETKMEVPLSSLGKALNLSPGNYKIVAIDNCGADTAYVTLENPTQVEATIQTNPTTCHSPGNGSLTVVAKDGSGLYNYTLSKYNSTKTTTSLVSSLETKGPNDFVLNSLTGGEYVLAVRDAARPTCEGFDTTFIITAPEPLGIDSVGSKHISCSGGNSGSIFIKAKGGIDSYIFAITRTAGNVTLTNSTGLFEELVAGEYTVLVKSGVSGCSDNYASPAKIVLTQPSMLSTSLRIEPVKCHGDTTGKVFAEVLGGVGDYVFTWESYINGGWNTFREGTQNITGVNAGEYRLKVQDKNGCTIISDKIAVTEPSPFVITQVTPKRYGCKGSEVNFITEVSGGVAPYITQYSKDNGPFVNFTAASILGLGSFTFQAIDANQCVTQFQPILEITDNALLITGVTTVNCYKSSNGTAMVKVVGGEEPYQYSMDNKAHFQPDPLFTGLKAGKYTILARDNRGCENSINLEVQQKQDTPELNFLVSTQQNALDTLVMTEVSKPKPDSLKWAFDPQALVIDDNPSAPKIKFTQEGTYAVSLTGYFDGCEYVLTKHLTLHPYDPNGEKVKLPGYRPIEKMVASPNPNDGRFLLKVKLLKKQQLMMVVYDLKGFEVKRKKWFPLTELEEEIDLGDVKSGAFMIRVITDNDAREVKLMVSK